MSRTVTTDYINSDNCLVSILSRADVPHSFHLVQLEFCEKLLCDANYFRARPMQWLSPKSAVKVLPTHSNALWTSKQSIKLSPKWETIRVDFRRVWQMNFSPSINIWNDKKMGRETKQHKCLAFYLNIGKWRVIVTCLSLLNFCSCECTSPSISSLKRRNASSVVKPKCEFSPGRLHRLLGLPLIESTIVSLCHFTQRRHTPSSIH